MNNLNPLFAPASSVNNGQQQAQDDFDLNEVFAEYFTNEFDIDPLNAYTNSMANFSGSVLPPSMPTAAQVHAAATAAQGQPSVGVAPAAPGPATVATTEGGYSLPTGGIKTAFHLGSSIATRHPGAIAPPQKKVKQESVNPETVLAPSTMAATVASPVAQLALAHQQASNAAAAQQQLQQLQASNQQQMAQFQAAQATQMMQAGAATAAVNSATGGMALPVGVGIRLGGLGGIAPATAQNAPPVMQAQYAAALWGGAGALGASSEQAVAERRQRNREHAKRSRVRKKFMLESLQEEVRSLQKENQHLRMLVQEHVPTKAMDIIAECCTTSPLFAEGLMEEQGNQDDPTKLGRSDFSLMESLTSGQRCFVLSDPKLPDNPIVFASPDFYTMTGYSSKQVLGRNCRFLQGPGTDPRAVEVIRKAIATGSDATVCLLNYKSDGTPFWNNFFIAALRDSDNNIVNYVGVQCEVEPETGDNAVEEKVNEVLPLAAKGDEADETRSSEEN
uniref:LOV domain-containing protein n=1 Tax=Entomoneis paludosa TaxID=265537 RepID=A0A7S2VA06_9STRA|mmetsp:Transcript_12996/g.26970  ORF Transcript_12996/g.26970 Transcript_12996/m.26970 type:complete len:504 (+) Transcript_12996:580-2091(+)|eukprot:CAMPEP_0172445846 /NCGR_PEP_ID=MMETSP1065-20121228/5628_1 /TAXON_ID=265537 /ORGANISM="Amphiprora paludosa, Strain CCMP125" /LENGTH=503 /DNA_ID=CAMNT_0013196853 /DNA_START=568 /DNA_END=2079 /DNA_ORIENTATION=-